MQILPEIFANCQRLWYFCTVKLRKECNLLELSVG